MNADLPGVQVSVAAVRFPRWRFALPVRRRRAGALRALAGAASLLLLPGLGGCGSLGSDGSLSAAQVRFVEVSPGAPPMDLYVNGTGAAYGLGFESFTSYLPVSPGNASLNANRAGGGQVLATAQGVLGGGHQYTAVISHGLGSVQERVYEDQATPAPAGEVAIRVLHEVTGAGPLSVYVIPAHASTPAASFSVAPGPPSSYTDLPASGAYTVTAAVSEGGISLPVASVTVKGGAGAVRTVMFAGVLTPGSHAGVVGFSLDDVDPQP